MTIRGTIENIQHKDPAGHEKKVVTLVPDHRQKAFVEFRGRNMDMLSGVRELDEVEIEIMFEGRVSRHSGIEYNNLVAVSLTKDRRFD